MRYSYFPETRQTGAYGFYYIRSVRCDGKMSLFDLDLTERHNEGFMKHSSASLVNAKILSKTYLLLGNVYFE